jgi:hypothetical protein
MNPFWKTILGTLLGAVSLVGAKYSADWIANHTYRAKPAAPLVAQVPRPVYSTVKVPNYFKRSTAHYRNTPDYRSTPDYPIHPYRSRH